MKNAYIEELTKVILKIRILTLIWKFFNNTRHINDFVIDHRFFLFVMNLSPDNSPSNGGTNLITSSFVNKRFCK